MQPLHKTGLLLVAIVLFPALIYLVFEVNALSHNEQMMSEIYEQQLETILYSVNQHAWSVADNWASAINKAQLVDPGDDSEIKTFLQKTPIVEAIVFSDTLLRRTRVLSAQDSTSTHFEEVFASSLPEARRVADRLLQQKRAGFRKLEPIVLQADENRSSLLLLYVSEGQESTPLLTGLIIQPEQFVTGVLAPKLQESGRERFALGLFRQSETQPVFATATLNRENVRRERTVWLFPDYVLGISLNGTSIEELTHKRFVRSFSLMGAMIAILLVAAWSIYRNVGRQIEFARMKSEFVSNVSHELRTPLALIRMYAETLELDRIPSETKRKEYYRIIGHEAERLTGIVNNILHFSRIEAGKKQYAADPIDLNDVVRDVLETYSFHLEQKGFTTHVNLGEALPRVRGDYGALSEALINLLDNAVKYSRDDRTIEVTTGREGKYVYLEVVDHGIGIPPAEQQKVFEQFYRVADGLIHNTKGTGLGLSLVKHIVHEHNGTITLQSQVGEGSQFLLSFPAMSLDSIPQTV